MVLATRPDSPASPVPVPARRRRTVWLVGALAALLVAAFAAVPHLVWLRASEPEFSDVLTYRHGDEMVLRTRMTHRSLLPVTLWPGEDLDLTLEAGFGNCRYYHEREVQVMDGLIVDVRTAGRRFARTVGLDQRLLVHAPMLVGCPDRTVDRGDDVRR